ncbi:protein of unknown function [Taphrina deformans PYCC 5710]|uniref:Uncharacterized protein n=1 Tax=Taphrina deformans (strain PYCC 5710 / ATCC 11124 / CBS 356.35 / IMI 108563 / JCM 9778 / NBRC 8474) TaxID=1097556 RepID=R4XBC6_TAPDE|nr:protein of unknown function [Taphrina deformans PYCC 5710]|eukprot:CCG81661.1 protein of unknown function [Taphrina deformans PYCC 5710]
MLPHHEAAGMPDVHDTDSAQVMSPQMNEKDSESFVTESRIDEKQGTVITIESIEEEDLTVSSAPQTAFDYWYRKTTLLQALVTIPLTYYLIVSDVNSIDWIHANVFLSLKAALLVVFHTVCASYRLGRGHVRAKGAVPWQVDVMSAVLQTGFCALHYWFAWNGTVYLASQEEQILTILPIDLY